MMFRHLITRFAERWLDVDHQNLIMFAVGTYGLTEGGTFGFTPHGLPQNIPMAIRSGVLVPLRGSYVAFPFRYQTTITHHARYDDRRHEWVITEFPCPYNGVAGDTLNVHIRLEF